MNDLLTIGELKKEEVLEIIYLTKEIKVNKEKFRTALKDKILAMVFEKPSLRTRMTFEVGMLEMGGKAIYLGPAEIQLGKRESIADVSRNLERWVDGIMIRTFGHENVEVMARWAKPPVINGLSDLHHPCQALADYYTLMEKFGKLEKLKLAYVGDGNNVCHSLIEGAAKLGVDISIATPEGYEPKKEIVEKAKKEANSTIELFTDPAEAVKGADAVYTDTWTSMGQEQEKDIRTKIFRPYQVNKELMEKTGKNTYFMHCLPAHRGEEVTDEIIDSEISLVFDEAENRLHVQKAIMFILMGGKL
ncbi:MAG: ornithine carbamoyltransferase [Candidatus Aminicenantia bacterium]